MRSDTKSFLYGAGTVVLGLLLLIVLAPREDDIPSDEEIGEIMTTYWACMDGCFNMMELTMTVDFNNLEQKALHDECADMCAKIYWPESVKND